MLTDEHQRQGSGDDAAKVKAKEAKARAKDKAREAEEGRGRGDVGRDGDEKSKLSPSSHGEDSSSSSSSSSSRSSTGSDVSPTNPTARASWNNKLGFILTCISFSVGLGNVWRFPYLCYKNGGGAFLLPFIIMLALVGMPLFFMELALGQFASLGPISIWKINPLFKGLGYGMVSVSWLVAVYYNVVIAHVILFLIKSLGSVFWGLPWTTCGNEWNTPLCLEQQYHEPWQTFFDSSDNTTDSNVTTAASTTMFTTGVSMATNNATKAFLNISGKRNTPAEEYYNNYVLEISNGIDDDGTVNWKLALCLLLAWTIVLLCLLKGIKSMGKVVYFTALFPYCMLSILLIRGLTLPGAIDGIIFYVKPDFDKLWSISVWSDAATQIFYSLSCCCGGLIAMASYNDFNYNCLRDSMIVPVINCLTSVFAGFVIFSILGFMAYEKGVDVKDVATGGPGLAFVVYPEALSRMPIPQLWAIFFFFMMAVLGFGSEFSIVECVLSALTDEFPSILRNKYNSYIFRTAIILGTFLLGLPMVTRNGMYLLNLVDASVSGFPLLVIGFFECVAIAWIYGLRAFGDDIHLMLGVRPNIFWKVCWMFIAPGVFLGLLVCGMLFYQVPTMDKYSYPHWAVALGWLIGLFPILLLPLYAMYYGCRHGGFQLFRSHMKPVDQWGPALREHREGTRYDGMSAIKLADTQFGIRTYNFNFEIEGMAGEFLAKYNEVPSTENKSLAALAQCFIGSSAKDDDTDVVRKNSGKFPVQVSRSNYALSSCPNCAQSTQSPINDAQPAPLCQFCKGGDVATKVDDETAEPNEVTTLTNDKDKY